MGGGSLPARLTGVRLRFEHGPHVHASSSKRTHGFLQLPSLFLKCAGGGVRTGP